MTKHTITGRIATATLLIIAASACSSQRDQLASELKAYGMQNSQAKCISGEMDDRLSKDKMKAVNKVLQTGRNAGDARPSEVIRAIKNLDDPYVLETAVKSSLGCRILR